VPYVPKFQSAVELHAALGKMKVAATTAFVSAMRDTPGQGAIDPHRATDPQILVDAMASYDVFERGSFYVRVDNATNAAVIGGRRPFGARPGRPLTAMLGYKHSFGP
jgi:Fe(3+) dicitrate transport protein